MSVCLGITTRRPKDCPHYSKTPDCSDGKRCGRRPIFDSQFRVDLLEVLIDRAWAEIQDVADIPARFATSDPGQNFGFPQSEKQLLLEHRFVRITELEA